MPDYYYSQDNMQRLAILEIGTNSIKFNISDCEQGKITTVLDTSRITRLGEGLQKNGKINPAAAIRNLNAITAFLEIARQNSVHAILAVGTMCLRSADNAAEFIDSVKEKTGLDIRVLSGDEEAQYTHLAITKTLPVTDKDLIAVDTGGGSTEFIFSSHQIINKKISLDLGAVQLTEKFLLYDPVSEREFASAGKYVAGILLQNGIKKTKGVLIGSGGTLTTLASMYNKLPEYDPEIVHGSRLSVEIILEIITDLNRKSLNERKRIIGLHPQRAEIILAGSLIIYTVMELMEKTVITVSDKGLRHALMITASEGDLDASFQLHLL